MIQLAVPILTILGAVTFNNIRNRTMITDENHRVWLTNEEMDTLLPLLPASRGKRRVDDQRVPSGIIFVQMTGCRWRDAPDVYGPHKTLYTRWRRWSKNGLFLAIFVLLAAMSMSRERNKTV